MDRDQLRDVTAGRNRMAALHRLPVRETSDRQRVAAGRRTGRRVSMGEASLEIAPTARARWMSPARGAGTRCVPAAYEQPTNTTARLAREAMSRPLSAEEAG